MIRGLLGRVGVRVGVALLLGLLIAGAVVLARQAAEPGASSGIDLGDAGPTPTTVDPSAGDDSEVLPTATYGDDQAVLAAATAFTAAWLRHDLTPAGWLSGLAQLSTKDLAGRLEGVDPAAVPASRTLSPPLVTLHADGFAQVKVEVDTGTLLLSLVMAGDHWLVSGVDWQRA